MRRFLIPFSLLIFFIALPTPLFASSTQSCGEAVSRCDCTDSDGDTVSLDNDAITDGDSCATGCSGIRAVSYEFFCGETSNTPIDSGNVSPALEAAPNTVLDNSAIPTLNVPLPTLSQDDLEGSVFVDANGDVVTNMIGIYVNAVFSYAIVIVALFGVLMLTIAGFQYMTAGGDKSQVTKAKNRMQNVIFGLILLMATYSIAFFIDPRTTRFSSLSLQNVKSVEYFPPEGEDINITPNYGLSGEVVDVEGSYISRSDVNMTLDPDALAALQEAAIDFYETNGEVIQLTSATRKLEDQAQLFYNNCIKNGGICSPITCNPASTAVVSRTGSRYSLVGSLAGVTSANTIINGLVANASYGNCPHTSAVAVDVWCKDGGTNYQHDPACQQKLIQTMLRHGFCRLTAEPWHFEFNDKKVSTQCLTSNSSISYTNRSGTFTPADTCMRWDFKKHVCVTAR